jgi:glutamine synthetase
MPPPSRRVAPFPRPPRRKSKETPMTREELIVACTSDLAGQTRGKAFPAGQFEARLRRGIGWTPTNVQITCFDSIAESPFGSLGDLVLIPDPSARVRLVLDSGETAEHFVMGAIHHTDGRAWEFCTRSILKQALARLDRVAGLRLLGAFEHEFQFRDAGPPTGGAFSLAGMRAEREFGELVVAAQRPASSR